MRINEKSKNIAEERYSEFYNTLQGPIDKVLNSRPVHLDTLNTYVSVDSSEKSISRFFWQNDKSTAIFKGPQGTGKSSTIFYMHKKFITNKTTSSIYFDMRQHQSKIPSEIWRIKNIDDRVHSLFPRVRDLIASRFNSLTTNLIDENNANDDEVNWEVFKYALRHHQQIIPQKFRVFPRSDLTERPNKQILQLIHEELSRDFSFQSMFHFIKYAFVSTELMGKKRVSVFIDNIDQMPYATLEAAVACANSYSSCATGASVRNVILGRVKFRFIIACRHHNYERLIERAHLNALGVNNHYPINHDGLPSLTRIVNKRLSRVKRFGDYNFKKGIRLVEIDAKKCIIAYFRQLEVSGTYRKLLRLNNDNLAGTLDTIRSITKNRYFPAFDEFVENYQFGSKPTSTYILPVNAATAASCIMWGNPHALDQAIYPADPPSLIPNLLSWNGMDLMSFLLPLRLIHLLRRLGATSDGFKLVSMSLIYQKISQIFPTSRQVFLETVVSMQKSRLVIFYAEEEITGIDPYHSLKLSPKAEYLLDYASRYEAIGLGFLEDLYVAQPENLFRKPIINRPLRGQSDAVKASLIQYCYDLEAAQIQVLEKKGLLPNYLSVFPREPLTDHILKGIKINIKEINEDQAQIFTKSLRNIQEKLKVGNSLHDMIEAASKQATIPIVFERGMQILDDVRLDSNNEANLVEIYSILAELRTDLEESRIIGDGKRQNLLERLHNLISYGRSGEKAIDWGNELLDVIDNAGPFLSSTF